MLLARRSHTVGNRRRYTVNYCSWLNEGDTVASGTAVSSSLTATVDGVATGNNKLVFFVNAGVLNETFTVSVQVTTSRGEVKNDTIEFAVLAP